MNTCGRSIMLGTELSFAEHVTSCSRFSYTGRPIWVLWLHIMPVDRLHHLRRKEHPIAERLSLYTLYLHGDCLRHLEIKCPGARLLHLWLIVIVCCRLVCQRNISFAYMTSASRIQWDAISIIENRYFSSNSVLQSQFRTTSVFNVLQASRHSDVALGEKWDIVRVRSAHNKWCFTDPRRQSKQYGVPYATVVVESLYLLSLEVCTSRQSFWCARFASTPI